VAMVVEFDTKEQHPARNPGWTNDRRDSARFLHQSRQIHGLTHSLADMHKLAQEILKITKPDTSKQLFRESWLSWQESRKEIEKIRRFGRRQGPWKQSAANALTAFEATAYHGEGRRLAVFFFQGQCSAFEGRHAPPRIEVGGGDALTVGFQILEGSRIADQE
jgi:hypothetical protein